MTIQTESRQTRTVENVPKGRPAALKRRPVRTAEEVPGNGTAEKPSNALRRPAEASAKHAVFKFEAASAREVLLAGEFTGWTKAPIKMEKDPGGIWNASLALPPGRYPYRFLVDGEWHDDPRCYQRVPNPYGTYDSIIDV